MDKSPPHANLVTFARPPVGEVALAVQFAQPVLDGAAILNDLWPLLRDRFPKIEVLGAAPPMKEEFTSQANVGLSFQLVGEGPDFRFWFISSDDSELVQVQADRITFNWRRAGVDTGYPRYQSLRERFIETLSEFTEVLRGRGVVAPPDWCEVSYLNPLPAKDQEGRPLDDLSVMLNRFAPQELSMVDGPEDTQLHERFVLKRDDHPIGRLIVNVSPIIKANDGPEEAYLLRLTARGLASSPDLSGAIDFLDFGREVIVNTFRDITTEKMHSLWGLQ